MYIRRHQSESAFVHHNKQPEIGPASNRSCVHVSILRLQCVATNCIFVADNALFKVKHFLLLRLVAFINSGRDNNGRNLLRIRPNKLNRNTCYDDRNGGILNRIVIDRFIRCVRNSVIANSTQRHSSESKRHR